MRGRATFWNAPTTVRKWSEITTEFARFFNKNSIIDMVKKELGRLGQLKNSANISVPVLIIDNDQVRN
jgi:hypothetical protein